MHRFCVFLFLLRTVYPQLIDLSSPINNSYTLSANLATNNPGFQAAVLAPTFIKTKSYYGWSTPSNSMKVQRVCALFSFGYPMCPWISGMGCPNQAVNLDTAFQNTYLIYQLNVSASKIYKIEFNWFSQAYTKVDGFSFYLNSQLILTRYDNGSCTMYLQSTYFTGVDGVLNIGFAGLGIIDASGINIDNLVVYEVTYNYQAIVDIQYDYYDNLLFSNSKSSLYLQAILNQNIAPRLLLGYIIQINHLPLYIYHNRNYSVNALSFLQIFEKIGNFKSSLPNTYVFPYENIDINWANSICSYKYNFSTYAIVTADNQNQNCFYGEIISFVLFDLCSSIIIFLVMKVLLKLFSKFKISQVLIKFTFNGYILLMLLDGKVQVYTFQFMIQLLPFNSMSLKSKLFNLSMLFVYFFIFLTVISLYFLYKGFYKKRARKLFENKEANISGCFYFFFIAAIFNIALGFVHRYLIQTPNLQIHLLISLELWFIVVSISFLCRKVVKIHMKIASELLLSLTRIGLQILFILSDRWSLNQNDFYQMMNEATGIMFLVYIGIYGISVSFEILILFWKCLKLLFGGFFSKIRKNKVSDQAIHILKNRNLHQGKDKRIFKHPKKVNPVSLFNKKIRVESGMKLSKHHNKEVKPNVAPISQFNRKRQAKKQINFKHKKVEKNENTHLKVVYTNENTRKP